VACAASSCKGRHIQKLHDFLKDVFREENQVHVVHGDDGWEVSDEAWELGEEMIIVGTVQQEEDCTWQDACNAWGEQDEEMAAGVHQVRICQEAAEPAAVGQCKGTDIPEESEEVSGPGGLLLEGEEQEYFLELLMRRASPERPKASPPTESKATLGKGKKGKNKGKKTRGKYPAGEAANKEVKEEKTMNAANSPGKQSAPDLAGNPEVKDRELAEDNQRGKEQVTRTCATSGGECSGQKMPDCS
jgi:hypothetical protein